MKCEYCEEKSDEYCHECDKPVCGEHSSLESDGDSLKAVCHNCVQKSHDDIRYKPKYPSFHEQNKLKAIEAFKRRNKRCHGTKALDRAEARYWIDAAKASRGR